MEYSEQEIEELNNQLYNWQRIQKELMNCKKFKSVLNEYGNIGKILWDNIMKAKTFEDTDWVVWCSFDKFINIIKGEYYWCRRGCLRRFDSFIGNGGSIPSLPNSTKRRFDKYYM